MIEYQPPPAGLVRRGRFEHLVLALNLGVEQAVRCFSIALELRCAVAKTDAERGEIVAEEATRAKRQIEALQATFSEGLAAPEH